MKFYIAHNGFSVLSDSVSKIMPFTAAMEPSLVFYLFDVLKFCIVYIGFSVLFDSFLKAMPLAATGEMFPVLWKIKQVIFSLQNGAGLWPIRVQPYGLQLHIFFY